MKFIKILFYFCIFMGLLPLVFGIIEYYVYFKPNGESFPVADTLIPFVAWWFFALIAKIWLNSKKNET